ncbi:flagellar motor switch protein FliN [soil metagenome]
MDANPTPTITPESGAFGTSFDTSTEVAVSSREPAGLEALFDVPVRVQAILGRARMPISELMALRPGVVVELDRRIGESIDILVNNRLIARGEVVMIDNSLGVTLTEIVRHEN